MRMGADVVPLLHKCVLPRGKGEVPHMLGPARLEHATLSLSTADQYLLVPEQDFRNGIAAGMHMPIHDLSGRKQKDTMASAPTLKGKNQMKHWALTDRH